MPTTEDEAVRMAEAVGVPADFAREQFNAKRGQNWRAGNGNPITDWQSEIKAHYSSHQRQRTTTPRRNGTASAVFAIERQLKEARERLKDFERNCDEHDPTERAELWKRRAFVDELSERIVSVRTAPGPEPSRAGAAVASA